MKEKNDNPDVYVFGDIAIEHNDSCAFYRDADQIIQNDLKNSVRDINFADEITKILNQQKLFNTTVSNTCYINDDGFEDERFDIADGKDYTVKMTSNEIAQDRVRSPGDDRPIRSYEALEKYLDRGGKVSIPDGVRGIISMKAIP